MSDLESVGRGAFIALDRTSTNATRDSTLNSLSLNIINEMTPSLSQLSYFGDRKVFLATALLLGLLVAPFAVEVQAQEQEGQTVSGTVTSAQNGEVMPGVNVTVKGANAGTVTNERGLYELTVPSARDSLIFSFVGYEEKRVAIRGRSTIDVVMNADVEELSELVVTGYGRQTRADVSGAVTSIDGEDLNRVSVSNTSNLMAGVPGLMTKQTSGLPGNNHRNLQIRGYGDPLVLVDGMEMSMDAVDPDDIESISVLKDASAAIYGARAGNGVILVETKRGEEGEPKINFSSSVSAQTPTAFPEHVDAGQYADMLREGALYVGVSPRFSEEEVQNYQEGAEGYESYDWYDATFHDYAMLQDYNMNVSGGTEDFRYYISGGYKHQNSALKSNDYKFEQWNLRTNVDSYINENWTASVNMNFRREVRRRPGQPIRDIFVQMNRVQPIYPPDLPGSDSLSYAGFGSSNPIATSTREHSGFDHETDEYMEGRGEISYDIPTIEGLSASGELGYRYIWGFEKNFDRTYELYTYNEEEDTYTQRGAGGEDGIAEYNDRFWEIRPEISLDYERSFGNHNLSGVGIVEWIESSEEEISASRRIMVTDEIPYLFAGTLNDVQNTGAAEETGRKSYIGRVQYGYDDRYRLEAAFRADASYKFPADSRWGYFPSISGSWSAAQESFLSGVENLDQLRLRLSYGQAGDDDVGAFQHLQGFFIRGYPRVVAGETRRIISEGGLPNPDITWRSMTTYNAGLDVTLWEGMLGATLDVFYRKSDGLFGTPQADFPDTFGADLPQQNINSTDTRGFDVELTHENQIGDINYSVSGNMSLSRRKWTDYSEPEYETEAERRVYKNEGKWWNRRVGYVALGLFESQEEIDNWDVDQTGNDNASLRPGDIKYKDLNGDGVLNWKDQKRIGYGSYPDMTYGFNLNASYEGFSLYAQFQGASMFDIQVSDIARTPYFNESTPFKFQYEHRWTPDDPESDTPTNVNNDAKIPYVDGSGEGWGENNTRNSTFWLKDGTYLRLKQLNLSYQVPTRLTSSLNVENVSLSVSGTNLITWDKLGIYSDAFDPESPGTQNARQYPLVKTYTLRLNVTL